MDLLLSMRRLLLPPLLLGLTLPLAWACGGSTEPELPPVASVRVTPALAVLDIGGTVQLEAVALTAAGDPIPEAELEWRSTGDPATVDATGLVTAVSAGVVEIEAASADGAVGRAEVRVSPVAAMSPDTGRYGAIVTLEGDAALAEATVSFSGPGDETVPATVRTAGAGELEVWVPVGAASGPLWLTWPGGTARTAAEFELTAGSDVLAGGATVPFPYHNPSLLGDAAAPHEIAFTLAEAGPFTLEISDRGPRVEATTVRAWLFRTDVEPSVLVSFVMTRDLLESAVLDSAAFSRASLPAGDYTLLVSPMDLDSPERTDVTRPFGLRLLAGERFERPPDAREPNDFPAETPTVPLPFTGPPTGELGFEGPYAMDHYALDVAVTTTLTLTTGAPDARILVYLFPDGVTDILEAWETDRLLAAAEGEETSQTVTATVQPGRYTALVWDWSGRARPYELEITGAVSGAGVDATPAHAPSAASPSTAPARARTLPATWARAAAVRPPWRPSTSQRR